MDDGASVFCPHCGYDLRTLSGDHCPECGGEVDRAAMERSQIPWSHRKQRGRSRAFWATVWQSTFHPERLVWAAARPVDYGDARRFQTALVVWLMAWVFIAAGAVTLMTWIAGDRLWLLPAVVVELLMATIFLFAATGVPSYWFHPKSVPVERQNRAVALSYYVSGPLAFLPLAVLVTGLGAILTAAADEFRLTAWFYVALVTALAGAALLLVIPLGWWRRCLALASATVQRRGGGFALMAFGLPLSWLGLAALCFLVIPGSVAWLWLVATTLLS